MQIWAKVWEYMQKCLANPHANSHEAAISPIKCPAQFPRDACDAQQMPAIGSPDPAHQMPAWLPRNAKACGTDACQIPNKSQLPRNAIRCGTANVSICERKHGWECYAISEAGMWEGKNLKHGAWVRKHGRMGDGGNVKAYACEKAGI